MELQDKVIEILYTFLIFDKEQISIDNSLDDLGADSLDLVEISIALENEFEIEITEEDDNEFIATKPSIKQIIDFVQKKLDLENEN